VNPALIGTIQDWTQVWFFVFFHVPTSGSEVTETLRPRDGYSEHDDWTILGAAATELEAISDDSDLTGIQSSLNTVTSPQNATFNIHTECSFRMDEFFGPVASMKSVSVNVRGRALGIPGLRTKIKLTDINTGSIIDSGLDDGFYPEFPTSGLTTNTWNLSQSGIGRLQKWDNVRMTISIMDDSFAQFQFVDAWIDIVTGTSSIGKLHGFKYIAPASVEGANSPIDVSWLRADGPAEVSDVQQDEIKLYAGTVEDPSSATQDGKIYEIGSPDYSAWVDVSQVTNYDSNARDKSWSFTGFGSMVIGTNYADEVQVKGDSDSLFRDLIGFDSAGVAIPDYAADGGVNPRARFAATIGSFLCLANCDPTSVVGTAQPYSFWCSRYAQPQYFAIGKIEWQSSVFQLAATPGEITGLVGGEWGLIFKENSVWRADYAGLPTLFEFTQITGMQGTVQPRSIVRVDDDVYFFSSGGIYVIRGGQKMEEVATPGSVRKFLFDGQFEEFAISTFVASLESESNARIVGGYDAYTGCVFWTFLTQKANQDEFFLNDGMLVYNPREGRFGFVVGDGFLDFDHEEEGRIIGVGDLYHEHSLELSGLFTLGNRQMNGETYLIKTVFATAGYPPALVAFSGSPTYEPFFRTDTFPSSYFGAKPGTEIEIHRIRPVLAVERQLKAPSHTIWIEANQSPAIGDGTGKVVSLLSSQANADGWIDLGVPLSGEFFKIATMFTESIDPILKEFHGWQVYYRINGDH
jgi:hypothetical protein